MIPRFRRKFYAGALAIPEASGRRSALVHPGCRFTMIPALSIKYPLLAKLAFVTQYESLAACTEIVSERITKPIEQLVLEGRVLKLTRTDNDVSPAYPLLDNLTDKNNKPCKSERRVRFTLHGDSAHVCPSTETKKDWLLVPATPYGRRKIMYFQDGLNCDATWCYDLAQIIAVQQVVTANNQSTVILTLQINKQSFTANDAAADDDDADERDETDDCWPSTPGLEFYMYKRYLNLGITGKVMTNLQLLDNAVTAYCEQTADTDSDVDSLLYEPDEISVKPTMPLFVRLLENPASWDSNTNVREALLWDQQSLNGEQQQVLQSNRYGLMPSQLAALNSSVARHLTVCWGPPGSGKTYWISGVVCTMIRLHQQSAQRAEPFTVLITSSTNSAIETCLEAVAKRLQTHNGEQAMNVRLIKVKGMDETQTAIMVASNIELVEPNKINRSLFSSGAFHVVGSTPYRLSRCGFGTSDVKQDMAYKPFDLMIIDEGSQLTVSVAAMAIHYLNTKGRLIVAGDHLQVNTHAHTLCYMHRLQG